jgi:hypothetical protein
VCQWFLKGNCKFGHKCESSCCDPLGVIVRSPSQLVLIRFVQVPLRTSALASPCRWTERTRRNSNAKLVNAPTASRHLAIATSSFSRSRRPLCLFDPLFPRRCSPRPCRRLAWAPRPCGNHTVLPRLPLPAHRPLASSLVVPGLSRLHQIVLRPSRHLSPPGVGCLSSLRLRRRSILP